MRNERGRGGLLRLCRATRAFDTGGPLDRVSTLNAWQVKELIARGVDVNTPTCADGWSAVHVAAACMSRVCLFCFFFERGVPDEFWGFYNMKQGEGGRGRLFLLTLPLSSLLSLLPPPLPRRRPR